MGAHARQPTTGNPRVDGTPPPAFTAAPVGALSARFPGALGIDADLDLVVQPGELAANKVEFARRARSNVLLADSSKWDTDAASKVMPLARVNAIVTDDGPDKQRANASQPSTWNW